MYVYWGLEPMECYVKGEADTHFGVRCSILVQNKLQ
jgi:hypothetical protein